MENYYTEWNKVEPFIIDTAHTIIGYSVGAVASGYFIPELRMALDCGLTMKEVPEIVLITHGHMDHSGQLHKGIIATQDIRPVIIVPNGIKEQVQAFIHTSYAMSTNNPNPKIHNKYTLIGADTKNRIEITIKTKPWIIDVIYCYHTVPTCGYGLSQKRTRLKEKYSVLKTKMQTDRSVAKDLTKSLQDLKNSKGTDSYGQLVSEFKKKFNVDIDDNDDFKLDENYEYNMMCYMGDTSVKVFESSKKILSKYPIIFIECTFLTSDDKKENEDLLEQAYKKRHVHWEHLYPIIKSEYLKWQIRDNNMKLSNLDKSDPNYELTKKTIASVMNELNIIVESTKSSKLCKVTIDDDELNGTRGLQKFMLFHFSARYYVSDINTFFSKYTDKDKIDYLPNLHIWAQKTST